MPLDRQGPADKRQQPKQNWRAPAALKRAVFPRGKKSEKKLRPSLCRFCVVYPCFSTLFGHWLPLLEQVDYFSGSPLPKTNNYYLFFF
ncbi:MAG: hypothetical protein CMQ13_02845 [Gammaproteobacteria bacterium]|nr:hypothetical protein [Gammaproteobacteria bacterium]